MKEKCYVGRVNRTLVKGTTYKEFTINYLTALAIEYKDLKLTDRIKAYTEYFVKNFNYDKNMRDGRIDSSDEETFEGNEEDLFNLLHKGRGVCMQLGQAYSLLTLIDFMMHKEAKILSFYTNFRISVNGKAMGHVVNTMLVGKETMVIDFSSMIHSRDGDYKQPKEKFWLPYLKEYLNNLKQEDVEVIASDRNGSSPDYMVQYKIIENVDEYYQLLNKTTDDILTNFQHMLVRLDIAQYYVKPVGV